MDRLKDRLPQALLQQLSTRGDVRRFKSGQILINEGDVADSLYVLLSGQLKVFSHDRRNREVIYNTLEPGEIFGEMLLDGGRRSASVKAIKYSECLVIDGDKSRELLRAHPDFAECLVLKLISRLRNATRTIRSLALDDVLGRVVALLEEVAIVEGDVHRVPRNFTQAEIANRVGASREMVNHIVRDLVKGGYIHKDARHQMTLLKKLPKH